MATGKPILTFRKAERKDCALIVRFIRLLADYEKLLHEVEATPEVIEEWVFDRHGAEVVFAEVDGEAVGFALYFYNFSTFVGRSGLYLEDLFVLPEQRGKGYGKALMLHLVEKAYNSGCGRMEWICLDWNKSSLAFYRSLGAVPVDGWTVQRLNREGLKRLAEPSL